VKEKSIVGDLINFRGLVYSPTNENGVIFLFGKVVEDLNMYIEEIKPGFPDCVGRRFVGKGWERVYIEFEYQSANFKAHGHDLDGCDMIVCWEHDWQDCPLEVIELQDIIKSLPNDPIQPPEKSSDKLSVEEHLKAFPKKIGELFWKLDERVKKISDEIWHKSVLPAGATYYCPERVFICATFQKRGIRLDIFARGKEIDGVQSFAHQKDGAKWSRIDLREENQLEEVTAAIEKSYNLIREAIENNEKTGWFAALEEEDAIESEDES